MKQEDHNAINNYKKLVIDPDNKDAIMDSNSNNVASSSSFREDITNIPHCESNILYCEFCINNL